MSTVRRRVVLASLLLVGVVLLPRGTVPVQAGDPDVNGAIEQQRRMQAELDRQRSQLASLLEDQTRLSASLQQVTADLDAVGVAIASAKAQLDFLSSQLDQARAELKADRDQLRTLAQDLRGVSQQIDDNQAQLAAREALLQDHLRTAYQQSQVSILEVILSSDSFTGVARELSDLMALSDGDRALAEAIRATRAQLEVRQTTLRNGRATYAALAQDADLRAASLVSQQRELDAARAALAVKQRELHDLQTAQESQLAMAVADADAYRRKIAQQEAAIAGQQALVEQLKDLANKLDSAYYGRFAWPLSGNDFVVTQEFGPTIYETFHTGIDVAYLHPTCGGPIFAAGDGVVLADGRPEEAFGDTAIGVIIGHSQRLQTWYWHLSREIVSVGQEVHTGDLIGYEGATGWATGCHLHFQVMDDGQPVNPRNYLP